MYGLEVCKSLHLPEQFLLDAHKLRDKYKEINYNVLDWKKSHFNSKHLKGVCEICKKSMGTDVHHLQYQQFAEENGFIGGFHKNHIANLLCVCDACHDKLHNSKNGHAWKKTSSGYQLQEIL